MSNQRAYIDHAFVAREAGDAPMLSRHLALHERARKEFGCRLHAELLRAIAPELRLSNEQASELWLRIVKHRGVMRERLGRRVSIVVAALDYLHECVGALHHPVLISESRDAQIRGRDAAPNASPR
jgi:hypothetical protein